MAYTQQDLDNIETAIAAGELEVGDGDTRVKYRSMRELMEARDYIKNELVNGSGDRRRRAFRLTVTKGLG